MFALLFVNPAGISIKSSIWKEQSSLFSLIKVHA